MAFNVIQVHWKLHKSIGHKIAYLLLVVCSINMSISHQIFDTTTFTVYVTVCWAPNLEMFSSFGKQLRLKTI